ncbi:carbohydrate esterase family 4 protein [Exidia glandulosa HHB12029]|uniref:Carbohydrate esterase family 4 protein n=1 Tax=Exidia glandulosa HHB12029 TaxID=1314781 RepID=A0A165EVW2_EXIGL|nr:carbohydrate esterase family 4 protein [Exidia glandulosa HHB12029]
MKSIFVTVGTAVALAGFVIGQNGPPPGTPLATIYSSCKVPNTVALTFDDGPYIYERDVINTLAQYNAKGTFFLSVQRFPRCPFRYSSYDRNGNNWACIYDDTRISAIRAVYNAGHQLGGHTWTHADLTTLTWDQIHDQMWRVAEALLRITGAYIAMFRPPYGSYNNLALQAIKVRNQSAVLWDFDSLDSDGATPAESKTRYDQLVARHPSTVLALNHSPLNNTVFDVLPHALSVLSGAGYRFVTVSDCLGGVPPYQFTQAPGVKDASWTC